MLFLCLPVFKVYGTENFVLADSAKFICNELLGRPTDKSITINFCTDKNIDAFIQYGTQKGVYSNQTPVSTFQANVPINIVLQNLNPSSTYFYRLNYRIGSTGNFIVREEHLFKTAKTKGTQFTFAVEADPHLDSNTDPELYKLTLKNILRDTPDFLFDLGDTFMSEKLKNKTQDSITYRHLLLRSYFDLTCHSVPLYLVIGNHEGECGWELNGTANSLAVMTSNTRTKYFPNPLPDNFYSGNNIEEQFVGKRQNYYAWEWGSALFVVIDPYWYTKAKSTKPEQNWNWTLGKDQYNWFKNVLETSKAKLKFVFAHQVVGGLDKDGRGGTEAAPYYESGGKNTDNSYGFALNRPDFPLPIHQLMVKNKVNIYFHGHDHFFDKQDLDGIVYQEVPQPGNPNYKSAQNAANYGYTSGIIIPCAGYLKVTVGDSTARVDYVRSYLPSTESSDRVNGGTSFSYTVSGNSVTEIEDKTNLPSQMELNQNFPNPFNPTTKIEYQLSKTSDVSLRVFDLLGREISNLVNERKEAGKYQIMFDGSKLGSGIYLYKLTAENISITKKMLLIK